MKWDPNTKESGWRGYAAHVLKKTKSGPQVCAQGIDPELYAYHDFVNDKFVGSSLNRKPASVSVLNTKANKSFYVCVPLSNSNDKNYELNLSQKFSVK